MCSIAGVFWAGAGNPAVHRLEQQVENALRVLVRRGPDESSVLSVSDRCVMGGNRLVIRGGIGTGTMPFRDDRTAAFFNGEIYNFARWQPEAVSDGEAIIPAYRELGLACFGELDGEFAISLWDADTGSLILARDHFGTKPLYLSYDGKRLLWASSPSAINQIEPHAFCYALKSSAHHLMQTAQEPYTSFKGIWLLPPGHILVANAAGVHVYAFHSWADAPGNSTDTSEAFVALERTLRQRLDYDGMLGIPLSGGIDSGIIAFMADRLHIPYHVFSVVETSGRPTAEAPFILERLKRLKPAAVTLLSCNRAEYERALAEMYQPDYYSCEFFDPGAIPMHTVMHAMRDAGVRVVVEGSGGDELFHGYSFRNEFAPVPGWPRPWRAIRSFYSMYTTLLAWTAKTDRAGGHFSIESRHPFQSVPLARAAMRLLPTESLKWPLRRYLLEQLDYGTPTEADVSLKFGFTLEHEEKTKIVADMQRAWCSANGLARLPNETPLGFPFDIGLPLPEATRSDLG